MIGNMMKKLGTVTLTIALVMSVFGMAVMPASAAAANMAVSDSTDADGRIYVEVTNNDSTSRTVSQIDINQSGATGSNLSISIASGETATIYLGSGTDDSANNTYYAGLNDSDINLQTDYTVTYGDGQSDSSTYDYRPVVSGQVTDSEDGSAVADATVSALSNETTTDSSGNYTLTVDGTLADVNGDVDVTADHSDYSASTESQYMEAGSSYTLDFALSVGSDDGSLWGGGGSTDSDTKLLGLGALVFVLGAGAFLARD